MAIRPDDDARTLAQEGMKLSIGATVIVRALIAGVFWTLLVLAARNPPALEWQWVVLILLLAGAVFITVSVARSIWVGGLVRTSRFRRYSFRLHSREVWEIDEFSLRRDEAIEAWVDYLRGPTRTVRIEFQLLPMDALGGRIVPPRIATGTRVGSRRRGYTDDGHSAVLAVRDAGRYRLECRSLATADEEYVADIVVVRTVGLRRAWAKFRTTSD